MLDVTAGHNPQIATAVNRDDSIFPAEARNLVLDLDGARLIDRVDLCLKPGPLTIVMGPNGAGKSLLLRLLHGMIAPTSGEITWGGRALDEGIRRRQAMVFQRPILLRRSVAANIDFVLGLRGTATAKRRADILDHVGLGDRARQPARLLSGGEQQRLALARALALDPQVLFLDEPTASLDPASVYWIEEIVRAAQDRGTKIIFVTHDIGQARRLGDEIVFLHRGRVLEHTPAASFFEAPASDAARDYLGGRIIL
ncbi:MAG: ATP-binding cassette domain-containing protein [Hyphomicrobiales bacterium]